MTRGGGERIGKSAKRYWDRRPPFWGGRWGNSRGPKGHPAEKKKEKILNFRETKLCEY